MACNDPVEYSPYLNFAFMESLKLIVRLRNIKIISRLDNKLSKLRLSAHSLVIGMGRHMNITREQRLYKKQECVPSKRMPHSHYHFLWSVDREIGVKNLI